MYLKVFLNFHRIFQVFATPNFVFIFHTFHTGIGTSLSLINLKSKGGMENKILIAWGYRYYYLNLPPLPLLTTGMICRPHYNYLLIDFLGEDKIFNTNNLKAFADHKIDLLSLECCDLFLLR